MGELTGLETEQVEPETGPETRRKHSDSQLELLCVNCNGLLSADNGSTYCRACTPWLVGEQPGRADRSRTRAVRSQRRK